MFTSVSNCSFWHGIDRFLFSLIEYSENKDKKEIIFNIVGEGNEINKLKKIVSKNEYLLKIVKFHGFKTGDELDEIYNITNICIGSLGRHRSGIKTMRALKNREYCATGLPMIFSEDDPDFRNTSFVYHVNHNEDIIDIKKIIEWYGQMNLSCVEIREYARKFSWDIQMKKILMEIE
ncbi:MAG: hypothetical protein ACRC1R_11205 [Cetobacterium sp.]|uniref:hypothetical protein n=1 Tax=Cetobacterium sp. TaxID=2071632 RepID=UPI003F33E7A2